MAPAPGPAAKCNTGNYFEDFRVGQIIRHAVPRTVTQGDVAVYQACYGGRFAVASSARGSWPWLAGWCSAGAT